MALEKAIITNLDEGEDIEVMFNPKEYVMEKKTPWSEVNVFGMDSPPVQFSMGERKRLSMELFFDTSEEKTDVREYTSKVEQLMLVNAQEHRPPILRFIWEVCPLTALWRIWFKDTRFLTTEEFL